MTKNRAVKKDARNRAAETGRSYTAARREGGATKRTVTFDFEAAASASRYLYPFGEVVGEKGVLAGMAPRSCPHIFITGPAGSGKTTAARAMVYSALVHGADVSIVASEDVHYEFARPYVKTLTADLKEIPFLLDEAVTHRATSRLIVLDVHDFSVLSESLQQRIKKILEHTMADRGLFVSFAIVSRNAGPELDDDFVHDRITRLRFGTSPIPMTRADGARMFFPTPYPPPPGDGVLAHPHVLGKLLPVRSWFAPNEVLQREVARHCATRHGTMAQLKPGSYTAGSIALRYIETYDGGSVETTVTDPDLVARAHVGGLSPDELHPLMRVIGYPAPRHPVTLDFGDALTDSERAGYQVAAQLIGAVGFFRDDEGRRIGTWLRHNDFVSTNESVEHTLDSMLQVVTLDQGRDRDWRYYALSNSGVRLLGHDLNRVADQITDDDLGFVACDQRAERFGCTVAFRRDAETWLVSDNNRFIHFDELIPSVEGREPRAVYPKATDIEVLGRPPIPGQEVEVGASIQMPDVDTRRWKVLARDERYIVVTHNAQHRVIDLRWNGVDETGAGPTVLNLITYSDNPDDPQEIIRNVRARRYRLDDRHGDAVNSLAIR